MDKSVKSLDIKGAIMENFIKYMDYFIISAIIRVRF
jgi:hypothetical protein